MWDESSGKSKAGWIKISVKPVLVNRTIKVACWVERQEKLEHLPTSSKAKVSTGIVSSTAPRLDNIIWKCVFMIAFRNKKQCKLLYVIYVVFCFICVYKELTPAFPTIFFQYFSIKHNFRKPFFKKPAISANFPLLPLVALLLFL